jgi:diguanylate cyclase (GGDEF)-like protein
MDTQAQSLEEAITELRKVFLAGLLKELDTLATSWKLAQLVPPELENLKNCHRHFHSLSGTAGTFGYPELGQVARQMELLLKPTLLRPSGLTPDEVHQVNDGLKTIKKLADEALLANQKKAPLSPTPASGLTTTPQIAFLSDDQETFMQMREQLGFYGYQVTHTNSIANLGDEVNEKNFSLLLLDMELGTISLSDSAVVEQLQKYLPPSLPRVMISERGDWLARLAAVRIGVSAYIQKPIDYNELSERLEEVLHPLPEHKYRILIIDDQKELSRYYSLILENAGMVAHILPHPNLIMETLDHMQPDLILMDLNMPECTGFELTQIIRQKQTYQGIPIVFLSGEEMASKQRAAMHLGGDDFLRKPIDNEELVFSVTHRAHRFRHLKSLMVSDSLTGLLNHAASMLQLETLLAQAERAKKSLCFVMIDIDHFKSVNDKYGHPQGDAVILSLTRLLQKRLRSADVIGRYGGEEFAVVLPNTEINEALVLINEIRENFSKVVFYHRQTDFHCHFSAGISVSPPGKSAKELVDAADEALYRAKQGGRNQVQIMKRGE